MERAVLIPFELRSSFVRSLEKGQLISPCGGYAYVDRTHHQPDLTCVTTKRGLASTLREIKGWFKGRSPSYAFRVSDPGGHAHADDTAMITEVIRMGIAPVLSVKGLHVALSDVEPNEAAFASIFFEFTKDEDSHIIKDMKCPEKEPASIHINAETRTSITPDGRHFLCGRGNRLACLGALDQRTKSLEELSGLISKTPQLSNDMLQALKRLLVLDGGDDGAPEAARKRARTDSLDDLDDDEFVKRISQRFSEMETAGVKSLINHRLTHRVKSGIVRVPHWVRGVLGGVKAALAADDARATGAKTIAEIFNIEPTDADAAADPALFDESWTSLDVGVDQVISRAIALVGEGRGDARELVRLWATPLRIIGVV
jgi:hypothetical protein